MKDKKKDIKVFTIIGSCILILLGIAYYQFDNKDKAYYVKYDIGEVRDSYNKRVDNIKEGLEVGQTFISKSDKLAKINISIRLNIINVHTAIFIYICIGTVNRKIFLCFFA